MNTKKVVFNKLFSTEAKKAQKLSKQRKISLSLMDKMETYLDSMMDEVRDGGVAIDNGIDFVSDFQNKYEAGVELIEYLEGYVKSYESYETQVVDLLDQYSSAADELGISPEDNDIYNSLSAVLNGAMADARVDAESVIYDLKQYIK